MPELGLLLLVVGALAFRAVATGRARNIPEDTSDFVTSLLSGDTDGIQAVFARRGENVSVDSTDGEVAAEFGESADTVTVKGATTALMNEAMKLGRAAKGYSLGATGPSFYDCSGLMWRASKNIGLNPTFRFTTSNFENALKGKVTKVTTPAIGDIILWRTHHMGVLIAEDKMYSARSTRKGIGVSTVSGDSAYFKQQPEYWRVTG